MDRGVYRHAFLLLVRQSSGKSRDETDRNDDEETSRQRTGDVGKHGRSVPDE